MSSETDKSSLLEPHQLEIPTHSADSETCDVQPALASASTENSADADTDPDTDVSVVPASASTLFPPRAYAAVVPRLRFPRYVHGLFFAAHLDDPPAAYLSLWPHRLTLLHFALAGLDALGQLDLHVPPGSARRAEIVEWVYKLQAGAASSGSSGDGGCSSHSGSSGAEGTVADKTTGNSCIASGMLGDGISAGSNGNAHSAYTDSVASPVTVSPYERFRALGGFRGAPLMQGVYGNSSSTPTNAAAIPQPQPQPQPPCAQASS